MQVGARRVRNIVGRQAVVLLRLAVPENHAGPVLFGVVRVISLHCGAQIFSRVFGPIAPVMRLAFILKARQGLSFGAIIKFVIGR